jgi:aldose 1-epimerase
MWIYTLESKQLRVRVTNFGARLVSIEAPDRYGVMGDVVLGYDLPEQYVCDQTIYLGATIGRYANRIAGAAFSLNGEVFHLDRNRDGNTLHGGTQGFHRKMWSPRPTTSGVEFKLESEDGDMGFPGNLRVSTHFTLQGNRLQIDYTASSDRTTVVNLTNHAYFNLGGDGCATIEGHELLLNADYFTPVDPSLIPTGEISSVAETPFDFTHMQPIGRCIKQPCRQLTLAGGYDHNWVLRESNQLLHEAAVVHEPLSGRTLTVATTEPGIQFNSGNSLNGSCVGRRNIPYTKHRSLCLETQHFPDSPNHPHFPSTVLRTDEVFRSTTTYTFSAY